jgi:hypothetical protein
MRTPRLIAIADGGGVFAEDDGLCRAEELIFYSAPGNGSAEGGGDDKEQ